MLNAPPLKKNGFSLVELSIVLVILGLLVGGVLSGQNLIKSAQLRKTIVQQDTFRIAIRSFRDKYFALPGDMSNATSFWGDKADCPDVAIVNGTPGTCNGNGDGQVRWNTAVASEHYRVWEQLALGGLLEGKYDFVEATSSMEAQNIGVAYPGPFMSNSTVIFGYVGPGMALTDYFLQTGHFLKFGTPNAGSTQLAMGIMQPDEAYNVDVKLDDGKPGIGAVMVGYAWNGIGSPCATTAASDQCISAWPVGTNGAAVTYNLQAAAGECSKCTMFFRF